jgi:hypothetical protein
MQTKHLMRDSKVFIQLNKIPKAQVYFGIFFFLFVALMEFVEIKNHKFWTNDFEVYYGATKDYFSGNNPYIKNYGLDTGFFKYPPTTLYFFGLAILFKYFFAQVIHILILSISFLISIFLLKKVIFIGSEKSQKSTFGIYFLGFIFIVIHIAREFHMGNVNLILLGLFSLGLWYLKAQKQLHVAIFWSIMVVLKPIVILAFIPLFFFKQWKTMMYMVLLGLIFLVIPIAFSGWNGNMLLWKDWFASVAKHGEYLSSENSLTYLTEYYFKIKSAWIPSLIGLLVLLGFMLIAIFKGRKLNRDILFWSIVLLAFTPNFFVTDTEHFVLTLPLLLVLVFELIQTKKIIHWIIFILLVIPFSLNSNDILGRNISDFIDKIGLMGISNIGFICFFLVLYFKQIPQKEVDKISI